MNKLKYYPSFYGDFIKLIDLIAVDYTGLKQLGPTASIIARAEGLDAHARAVEKRLQQE